MLCHFVQRQLDTYLPFPKPDSRCSSRAFPRLLRFRGCLHALARTADRRWRHSQLHVSAAQRQGSADGGAAHGRAGDVRVLVRPL